MINVLGPLQTRLSAGMTALLGLSLCTAAGAVQVHHFPGGGPWDQRANEGPDAAVPGWFYQLGVTGIRVRLDDEFPTHLIVGHVFEGAPAEGRLLPGDHITGAGGKLFETPHRNGYGMDVFGPKGPIEDFANELSNTLNKDPKKARLRVTLLRDGNEMEASISLSKARRKAPAFAATFPYDCKRTEMLREELLEFLVESQREDGSFGHPVHNTFAPLALLASGQKKYRDAVLRCVRFHASTTKAQDQDSLVNWRYMSAGIVLCEWYLATQEKWVLPELEEIYQFLYGTQYVDLAQVRESVKESHPDSYPKGPMQQHGGWGHNPGFEGYGPIAMLTGQGALCWSLMKRCGIDVDEERHMAAYAFLDRGTGPNGYLWYADDVANPDGWADMGRTGASALAHFLSPYGGHKSLAMRHTTLMGESPLSFPDTHGSPLMGMGYGAAATVHHRPSFEKLMQANRWWFLLADCGDGTFHYQPNRDNAGYGNDARLAATAVTAFMLWLPERSLALSGK